MVVFYILSIDNQGKFNPDKLKEKLDLSLDWVKIMPNIFILKSTSKKEKWYDRLKPVLNDNKFFLVEVNLDNKTGWLSKWTWDWMKKNK